VRTLAEWRSRFLAARDRLRALGRSERFLRTWDFYLAYCQGAFAERMIGLAQLLFEKPAGRRPALLGDPFSRADQ
jgi:cyclopropane-fatty-acyl-phospholipid synthase